MIAKKTRKRETISQGVRFDVFRRDNFTCVYCGRSSPEVTLHCDHAKSHSTGGTDDKDNLVTACSDCNLGKGATSVKARNVAANDNGLVGLYGHTRDDDGVIDWQFKITGMINADECTCQLFSWMDGRPTKIVVLPVAELCSEKCSLYSNREEWRGQAKFRLNDPTVAA